MAQPGDYDQVGRVSSSARGLPTQHEKAQIEGQGSAVLGLSFKAVERLALRLACRQACNSNPMEEAEISRILEEEVTWEGWAASYSEEAH